MKVVPRPVEGDKLPPVSYVGRTRFAGVQALSTVSPSPLSERVQQDSKRVLRTWVRGSRAFPLHPCGRRRAEPSAPCSESAEFQRFLARVETCSQTLAI